MDFILNDDYPFRLPVNLIEMIVVGIKVGCFPSVDLPISTNLHATYLWARSCLSKTKWRLWRREGLCWYVRASNDAIGLDEIKEQTI